MKSITNTYNKMTNFGKLLLLVIILLAIIAFFRNVLALKTKEGFEQNESFLYKKDVDVFDNFYSEIYDYLVFNNLKNDYEVGSIVNTTNPKETSVILDVGCGTGHHVANLASKNLNVIGIDISPSMVKKAKEKYPEYNFQLGDVLDSHKFKFNSLTHILCMYFTIYYFKDKRRFFDNCMEWLMPGGYLVLHLVDRETFDPILPPGNPLYIVSPQKYAKERITDTKITFEDFVYTSRFNLDKDADIATFDEKFKSKVCKNCTEPSTSFSTNDILLDSAFTSLCLIFSKSPSHIHQ
jgi:SAM-dependent methyltransferase